ncbi:MAG: translational GTPase TypA [Chlamydiae bacterium]|nr:translational GTPase TypA [Chlamydiota bacterium]
MTQRKNIRNIAIIAHIDHGKTTLIDQLLKQANLFRENEATDERMMDSNDLEKERGITIFAKHTSLPFKDTIINIIDTPGHADFSGEVERVLGMVQSVLLLVDAQEGPMPQTRFVLSKSLKMGLKPILVINKIDKPNANVDRALNLTFDLFVELGANDAQLDFKHIYASGIGGYAINDTADEKKDMTPLFDLIVNAVEPPSGDENGLFLMQVSTLSYSDYLGRQVTGRVLSGSVRPGQQVLLSGSNGKSESYKVTKVEGYRGIKKVEFQEGCTGDIICISGLTNAMIGDTVSDPNNHQRLPPIPLDEPTISVKFMVNSSPLVGKEGKHVTMNKIRERLLKEKRANISYRINDSGDDAIEVCGRGELHLSVLIETMRREGFEFSISKPVVVLKKIEGEIHEPFERVFIEVPEEFSGSIIETLSKRKGEMQNLSTNEHGISSIEFIMPMRGLMGYRSDFLTQTKGKGILTSLFHSYESHKGEIEGRHNGVLISNSMGQATAYSIFSLQERGIMFIQPGQEIYEGMVIGEHNRDNDLVVNPVRGKQLTNVRASGSDENIILTPPRILNLEQAIDFIEVDELIEVTPKSIRLRKQELTENERKRRGRSAL